ncbi:histidine kinase [Herbiconiux sp. CPCC 203407]|uniref:histidine kinase n=1 Tax=Herbiconiux oxytropis TaxID=2970915 RepID=A0AA41XD76_9MICO|nr:histidine kinase [Herbiconiux oxytropis]MCS5723802.1 histidine kinase [Herbiconiux oxytropis]MCS5725897.1 histidine kinase [Herbiconiux oxytropis]
MPSARDLPRRAGSDRDGHDLGHPQVAARGRDGIVGESAAADADEWVPRFRMPRWVSLWLPVVVSFLVQVPAAVLAGVPIGRWRGGGTGEGPGSADGDGTGVGGPGSGFGTGVGSGIAEVVDDDPVRFAVRVALALVGPLALVFARRFPGPVVAVVTAAAGGYVLVLGGDAAPPYVALAFAVVGAVVRGAGRWAVVSLTAGWALTLSLGILLRVPWQPALVVAVTLGLVLLVAVGESIRTRRRRFDELRRRATERRLTAAQAERVRIARELHDVLAHSLSEINVQAGVGLHLIDSRPEEAATALAHIKSTSKSALDEVRSVLGILRAEPAGPAERAEPAGPAEPSPLVPEPGLDRFGELVESARRRGLEVDLRLDLGRLAPGASLPGSAVQLALYRIAQESLTNVVRHSAARRATVTLVEEGSSLRLTVSDPGAAARPTHPPAAPARPSATRSREHFGEHTGRGLLGMRERAELLGGTFAAGPDAHGGFTVVATVPRHPGEAP